MPSRTCASAGGVQLSRWSNCSRYRTRSCELKLSSSFAVFAIHCCSCAQDRGHGVAQHRLIDHHRRRT